MISKIRRDELTLSDIKDALSQNLGLRLFLYTGQLDSFVPPSVADEERKELENLITYREFSNSGHEVFTPKIKFGKTYLQKINMWSAAQEVADSYALKTWVDKLVSIQHFGDNPP